MSEFICKDAAVTDVEMVVNLHVTERCNYQCTYCFGKWLPLEGFTKDETAWAETATAHSIMSELAARFRRDRSEGSPLRFNFVGGEPALLPNVADLIEYARHDLQARASYVTNGLMLQRFTPEWTVENVAIVGVSIDSSISTTNLEIGRATRSGMAFDLGKVADQIAGIREAADRMKVAPPEIKVNTVVSALNVGEDFENVLTSVRPDRWKILKMLPVYSSETAVSDEAFREFARQYEAFVDNRSGLTGVVITTEDNDEMTGSYAMVDPLARFFWYDEVPENGYGYSEPMTEVSVDEAWNAVPWDQQKFDLRYTELMGDMSRP
ncbi:viperin family antiviral radical SAM protein [Nocardioides sp. NPDC057577]|uniref:viperin family antiviral radical SAM protein n=1 Tax=Nocardioides sp. NPDC057577 TaxID=3346171 RepID=UPI00366A9E8C